MRWLKPLTAMCGLLAMATLFAASQACAQYDYPSTGDLNRQGASRDWQRTVDGASRWPTANAEPYPSTESLGPYDSQRQREELPDFRPQQQPAAAKPELLKESQLIGIAGNQYILAGDLLGDINQLLKPYEGQATKEELDAQRQLLMQKMLPQMIQTKMLYQEMLSTLPDEARPQIDQKLGEEFDKKQLPTLIERAKVNSAAELDAKLREFGTSIEKQRRQFGEQVLARELIRTKIDAEPEISHQQMLEYYQKHLPDYDREARVRWEELSVRFSEIPNRREAYRAIAQMGNRVLRNAAFSRVAREDSQGYTASDGGWHDWTSKGSLRATELDEALFSLPIGELSQIIETDEGFHIIRVLDREQAGRSPFFKEQVRIKQLLQKEKRDKQVDEFIADLQARTRVWTIFDDGAQPTP